MHAGTAVSRAKTLDCERVRVCAVACASGVLVCVLAQSQTEGCSCRVLSDGGAGDRPLEGATTAGTTQGLVLCLDWLELS